MVRIPLPDQVASIVRGRIQSGQWSPESQIPAEDELARSLGVSRATVREGISQLIAEGYLVKRRGVGTFVRRVRPIHGGLDSLSSITELIEGHGFRAGSRHVRWERRAATEVEREQFKDWPDGGVVELHRVRTADGAPILYCVDILPEQFAPHAPDAPMGSLFRYLEEQHGQTVECARSEIDALAAPDHMARALGVAPGSPLLVLRQAHYNQHSTLLLWSRDHFVPGTFRFDITRQRPER